MKITTKLVDHARKFESGYHSNAMLHPRSPDAAPMTSGNNASAGSSPTTGQLHWLKPSDDYASPRQPGCGGLFADLLLK